MWPSTAATRRSATAWNLAWSARAVLPRRGRARCRGARPTNTRRGASASDCLEPSGRRPSGRRAGSSSSAPGTADRRSGCEECDGGDDGGVPRARARRPRGPFALVQLRLRGAKARRLPLRHPEACPTEDAEANGGRGAARHYHRVTRACRRRCRPPPDPPSLRAAAPPPAPPPPASFILVVADDPRNGRRAQRAG